MGVRTLSALTAITLAAVAASCMDAAVVVVDPIGEAPPEAEPTPPRFRGTLLGVEGYETPGEVGTGFIVGPFGRPMQVTYEIHDGLAIWEGDIVLGREGEIARSVADLDLGEPGPLRGVVIDGFSHWWPSGVVPYIIDPFLPNQDRIADAIRMVEDQTPGIRLVVRSGQSSYVKFTPGSGCSSAIGAQGGEQAVSLALGCGVGNTAHEILHAVGLFHEHTRCDRDSFVQINTDSIEAGREHNFTRQCDDATDVGEYNESSIMHYPPEAFSVGGRTIVSLRGREGDMGQRSFVADTDAEAVHSIYGLYNIPPVATIGALAPGYPEGTFVGLDGSASSDADDDDLVLRFRWTFGDGTCAGTPPLACLAATTAHLYADDGVYPVTLNVSDGFEDDSDAAVVTVFNVPPSLSLGHATDLDEGGLFSREGSFEDPGADRWSGTVDYDDGRGPRPLPLEGKTFRLAWTYPDDGERAVTVTVTDDDEGVGGGRLAVRVANVAPSVDAGPDVAVESGRPFEFTGSFSDPGRGDHPWAWVLDWGFGEPSAGNAEDMSAPIAESRRACLVGAHPVRLTVTDKDGGTGSDEMLLTVFPVTVAVDVMPGTERNPVNLRRRGRLPVAILGSPRLDPGDIDPASLTLGDGSGAGTPPLMRRNGSWEVHREDVDGDGLVDLVAMFDVEALVADGHLSATTTELVLQGALSDGCTSLRGSSPVTPL